MLKTSTSSELQTPQFRIIWYVLFESLSLKPSPDLELLVNKFNNATPENSNEPEKVSSSKYYDIEEMHNIKITHQHKSISIFHINACSLNKSFDGLQHHLSCPKKMT